MFCCDNNKNKMACYEGMIAGGIIIAASIFAIKIFKKMEKQIQEFEIQERKLRDQEEYNKTSENDEDIELKEKVDEFNSRRLTKENESKDNHMD